MIKSESYRLRLILVALILTCKVKAEDFAREVFLGKIQNSAFTAVIEVKDGKRKIRDVIVGNAQKFKFLENGQLSNPDKDRIYLIILNDGRGDSERSILTVRDGVIRFGIRTGDTETIRNLIARFQKPE